MSKIYLFTHDQIKCNFCMEWFTVPMTFAEQQRYSLNLCEECHKNFQYKVVHPATRQIYELKLLRTGVILDGRPQEAEQKLNNLLMMLKDKCIPSNQQKTIKQQNVKETQRIRKIMEIAEPVKQKITQICTKLINMTIKKCYSLFQQFDSDINKYLSYKEQLLIKLKDHAYNYKNANKNISFEDYKMKLNDLYRIQEKYQLLTAEPGLAQIRQMLMEFLDLNFHSHATNYLSILKNNEQQDKENGKIQAPAMNKLRSMRQKLTQKSSNKSNKNLGLRHQRTKSGLRNSRNILTQRTLNVNQDNKSMLSRSRKSSKQRGSKKRLIFNENSQCQKAYNQLDQYRQQMSKLMREKTNFDTYMPIFIPKQVPKANKTYGDKPMLQYLVELKTKTIKNPKLIEIINQNLAKCNFSAYLKSITCNSETQIIKFVKASIGDAEFDSLLFWLSEHPEIKTLVATNNLLTQNSVLALQKFLLRHPESNLRNIYLGNNFIKGHKIKNQVERLRDTGIVLQI